MVAPRGRVASATQRSHTEFFAAKSPMSGEDLRGGFFVCRFRLAQQT